MKNILCLFFLFFISDSWSINSQMAAQNKAIEFTKGAYSLIFYGDAGEYVSSGAFSVFGHDKRLYKARGNPHAINFSLYDYKSFYVDFAALYDDPLQVMTYKNALRYPFNGQSHPGLAFNGDGRGCNQVSGKFKVLEIEVDANGNIQKFAADFEHHCEKLERAVYGSVRYNSDISVISNPSYLTEDKIEVPLVEIKTDSGKREYNSLVMHETYKNSNQYVIDSILPAVLRDKNEIFIPAAYDIESERFVIPSVIQTLSDGSAAEFEMRFFNIPKNLKVGDYLTLDEIIKIR